jgi:hypothetical protein
MIVSIFQKTRGHLRVAFLLDFLRSFDGMPGCGMQDLPTFATHGHSPRFFTPNPFIFRWLCDVPAVIAFTAENFFSEKPAPVNCVFDPF